ncbi:MAG: hypothetical protein ACJ757_02715 [Gaiellaceae bacterium]
MRFQGRSDRYVTPAAFWNESYLDHPTAKGEAARDLIVHVLQDDPLALTVTFAAVDDAASIADAIGSCFDAFLIAGTSRASPRIWDNWSVGADALDTRVQANTPLALAFLLEEGDLPIFGLD